MKMFSQMLIIIFLYNFIMTNVDGQKKLICLPIGSSHNTIYIGDIKKASDNSTCEFWTGFDETLFPYNKKSHNFCRNPDKDPNGNWCQTKNSNKTRCNIPTCDPPLKNATTTLELDNCLLVASDNVKWAVEEDKYICNKTMQIKMFADQSFDECSINCQFLEQCESFQLVYNKITRKTNCHLIRSLSFCEIDNQHGNKMWSRKYCNEEENVIPWASHEDICQDVNSNRQCTNFPYELKWIRNDKVYCTNSNAKFAILMHYNNDSECIEECLKYSECVQVRVNIQLSTCALSSVVNKCDFRANGFENRFWMGCCKKLKIVDMTGKPRADCVFPNPTKTNYNGKETQSKNGHQCLKWSEVQHIVYDESHFPENSTSHNNCRNINADPKGPWCFVTRNFLIEYCNVHQCQQRIPLAQDPNIICLYSTKSSITCNQAGHTQQWVEDKSVQCSRNHSILSILYNATIEECQIKCENDGNCVSFITNKKNNMTNCVLKKEIDICQSSFKGTSRWFIGCCKKLQIKNVTQIEGKMETCQRKDNVESVYVGAVDKTNDGNCQRWIVLDNILSRAPYPYNNTYHRFCRNMNEDPLGPWCIISGSFLYQNCHVPICNETQTMVEENEICLPTADNCLDISSKLKWVYDQKTSYCTQDDPKAIIAYVDYPVQCRDKCIQTKNCSFVRVRKSNSDYECQLSKGNCTYAVGSMIASRFWLGCCKKLHVFPPRSPLVVCMTEVNSNNYHGNTNVSKSGAACLNWYNVRPNIARNYFPGQNNMSSCRNLNNDLNGPWCFVTGQNGIEYCNVKSCSTIFNDVAPDMICYQNQSIGLQTKCNKQKQYELGWILEQGVSCIDQPNKVIFTQTFTRRDRCKDVCEQNKNCSSAVYNDTNCKLYNVVLKCQQYRSRSMRDKNYVANRWFRGCCKTLVLKMIENEKYETEYYRAECKDEKHKIIYFGNDNNNNKCIEWATLSDRKFPKNHFPDQMNNHSFCRNINFDPNGPWCVTNGLYKFEYCPGIKECQSTKIPIVSKDDICYQNAFPDQQKECILNVHKLKWVQESGVVCNLQNAKSLKEVYVFGIVDCKEKCLENDQCISILYTELHKTYDNKAHNLCLMNSEIFICKPDSTASTIFIWLGCCHKLNLPNIMMVNNNEKVKRDCLYTEKKMSSLVEYSGKINLSKSGKACLPWKKLRTDLSEERFSTKEDYYFYNYCRNPNDDVNGAWCIVTGQYFYEHCHIPFCEQIKELQGCGAPNWFIILITFSWIITLGHIGKMLQMYYNRWSQWVEEDYDDDDDKQNQVSSLFEISSHEGTKEE